MIKNIFKKIGIPLIVVVCAGTIFLKYKSENTNNDVQTNIQTQQENELENTYIDDGYNSPNKEDLEYDKEDENYIEEIESKDDESTKVPVVKDEVESKPQEENKVEEKPSVTQKTGSFQGFADSNFIEVKIGDDYATYMVSPDAKKNLANKAIDSNITFTLSEVNGQKVITSVK